MIAPADPPRATGSIALRPRRRHGGDPAVDGPPAHLHLRRGQIVGRDGATARTTASISPTGTRRATSSTASSSTGSGWLCLRRNPPGDRLIGAVLIEAGWELLENSRWIIDRYREATMALGYNGDTVINSIADVGWMMVGFASGAALPVWATLVAGGRVRALTLAIIRDNLTSERAHAGRAERTRDPGLAGGGCERRRLSGCAIPPRNSLLAISR